MAASPQTALAILAVLERYVPDANKRKKMLAELADIPGNKSYRDTIYFLQNGRKPAGAR